MKIIKTIKTIILQIIAFMLLPIITVVIWATEKKRKAKFDEPINDCRGGRLF